MKINDENMTVEQFAQACQLVFAGKAVLPNADVYRECMRARCEACGQVSLKVALHGEHGTVYQVADEHILKALVGILHESGETFNYGEDYKRFEHDAEERLYGFAPDQDPLRRRPVDPDRLREGDRCFWRHFDLQASKEIDDPVTVLELLSPDACRTDASVRSGHRLVKVELESGHHITVKALQLRRSTYA